MNTGYDPMLEQPAIDGSLTATYQLDAQASPAQSLLNALVTIAWAIAVVACLTAPALVIAAWRVLL